MCEEFIHLRMWIKCTIDSLVSGGFPEHTIFLVDVYDIGMDVVSHHHGLECVPLKHKVHIVKVVSVHIKTGCCQSFQIL